MMNSAAFTSGMSMYVREQSLEVTCALLRMTWQSGWPSCIRCIASREPDVVSKSGRGAYICSRRMEC